MATLQPPTKLDALRVRLYGIKNALWGEAFVASYQRNCPVCGYNGLFLWHGNPPRRDARCPKCGSLERHRLLKLWFDANVDRLRGGRALHFAPEAAIVKLFKPVAGAYFTADIVEGRADKVLNIENMSSEPSDSYDWIICSHVLEHVDDRKALAELHRIMKPTALLIVMIPIIEGWSETFEDPAITSSADRALFYGQSDHVRFYGSDVRLRFLEAGFAIDEFTAKEPLAARHGLTKGESVFVARCARTI
jgi:SAM-dependent methyltransferase